MTSKNKKYTRSMSNNDARTTKPSYNTKTAKFPTTLTQKGKKNIG